MITLWNSPDVLFGMCLPFQIIPQCVSEPRIHALNSKAAISDYENILPLKVGGQVIGAIDDILEGKHHISIQLPKGWEQFDKTLVRNFAALRRSLPKLAKNHGRRYIFILDRRNPQSRHSPNYQLNGQKSWNDTLHIWCPSDLPSSSDLFPEGLIERTMGCMLPLGRRKRIGAKHLCNGHMFATSYHLFEADKVKTYFMNNGHGQRFTQYEYQYYWPRLFMKVDGKFQDDRYTENMLIDHRRDFDKYFERSDDREHFLFKKYTISEISKDVEQHEH